jgi:hypothetical protein
LTLNINQASFNNGAFFLYIRDMKKLILFFLVTTLNIYPQNSSIQEEINLNSFKYIIIEKLESNSLNWSSLGLSDFIEKTLEKRIDGKRKYTVVSLKESRPKDLIDNPSLVLRHC